jgi:hypothetical protein
MPAERFYEDINQFLVDEEARVMEIYGKLRREGTEINNDIMRRYLDAAATERNEKPTLYSHIETVIQQRRDNGKKSRDGKDHRLFQYNKAYSLLKEFATAEYRRELTFEDIDLNFYNKYIKWLRDYPYAENTVGSKIEGVLQSMIKFKHHTYPQLI